MRPGGRLCGGQEARAGISEQERSTATYGASDAIGVTGSRSAIDSPLSAKPYCWTGDLVSPVVRTRRRVLIDWDWGAEGIWTVLSPEELGAPVAQGRWLAAGPRNVECRRPWSGLLTSDLSTHCRRGTATGNVCSACVLSARTRWLRSGSAGRRAGGAGERSAWGRLRGPLPGSDGAWSWVRPPWDR